MPASKNIPENRLPFLQRLWIYQRERFPIVGHGLLVTAFSFSAMAYARIGRQAGGFVHWPVFAAAVFTTFTLFFLVRVFDEFKDAHDDALYRKNLPVPRGLITLRELKYTGLVVFFLQFSLNALFFPRILWLYAVALGYLCLMGREFFIAAWLKKHPFWYVVSHMLIIPLIDMLASGYDWLLEGSAPPRALYWFFAVSFLNGIVLEVGRKLRDPRDEAEGVLTYSAMLGPSKAVVLWILLLWSTAALCLGAALYAGHGTLTTCVLVIACMLCTLPALLFGRHPVRQYAHFTEYASAAWTIIMYLSLGGIPKLTELLS